MFRIQPGKRALALATPLTLAVVSFLDARTVSSLVGALVGVAPIAVAAPALAQPTPLPDRRPSLAHPAPRDEAAPPPPQAAAASPLPRCTGIVTRIVVGAEDPAASLAAFEIDGRRNLGPPGRYGSGLRLVRVGGDRLLFEGKDGPCEAPLFPKSTKEAAPSGGERGALATPPPPSSSPFAGKIHAVSETEFVIDRSAMELFARAETELVNVRAVPDPRGVVVRGIKEGSVLALLGIRNRDRLESVNGIATTDFEKMIALYARLRSQDITSMVIHLTRGGLSLNLDYSVR